jgi:hypothetical protein
MPTAVARTKCTEKAANIENTKEMSQTEYETAVAEFIRTKGVTRCPTVCVAPTQASVDSASRIALQRRAEQQELRRQKHSTLRTV